MVVSSLADAATRTSKGRMKMQKRSAFLMLSLIASCLPSMAWSQDSCPNRGQLDTIYCDANNDLVADVPTDPAKQKDPSTLIFAWSPTENPAVYKNIYDDIISHMSSCTGKRVVFFNVQSNSAQIEAQRAGRLHIALYATGAVGFSVNMAGGVPFVGMGSEKGVGGYQVYAIVRADSPYKTLADLKGKKVAHVSPSSNSGNLAPRVFFAEHGLKPDEDYKPLMSGGHDKSILGVSLGDYDGAAVASDIFERMVARGQVKGNDIRIIWKSETFPTTGFVLSHDLKPELSQKITQCMISYKFSDAIKKEYAGNDRFIPITYKETWKPIREVAERSGTPYNRVAYEAQRKRDEDAAAKKAAGDAAKAATPAAPATAPKP
jgi:phosphonate transport system substrate-binding protein